MSKEQKDAPQWERIELDYRAGIKSLRQIAAEQGISDPADAATLEGRGQVPLVFNEVAVMCDWLIGTERRARVDWSVLPRTEDDVQLADVKTKVLKYVSDVNRTTFNRSRAFEDAIKVGVGWLDDGVCNDPTKDVIYSKYEDWRSVLWDSMPACGPRWATRWCTRPSSPRRWTSLASTAAGPGAAPRC